MSELKTVSRPCFTHCPFKTTVSNQLIMIGSDWCKECDSFEKESPNKQHVECSYQMEDNEKRKEEKNKLKNLLKEDLIDSVILLREERCNFASELREKNENIAQLTSERDKARKLKNEAEQENENLRKENDRLEIVTKEDSAKIHELAQEKFHVEGELSSAQETIKTVNEDLLKKTIEFDTLKKLFDEIIDRFILDDE